MATELQAEIARARALRADALDVAGVTVSLKGTLYNNPDAGFGYRASKIQKQVPELVREARLIALENRPPTSPPTSAAKPQGQVLQLIP